MASLFLTQRGEPGLARRAGCSQRRRQFIQKREGSGRRLLVASPLDSLQKSPFFHFHPDHDGVLRWTDTPALPWPSLVQQVWP